MSITDSLRLHGVTRRYGRRVALDAVTATVAPGTLCAVCGGNGAGKSTLLRIIAGFLDADGGRITVPPGARLGYLPEGAPLPPELTVAEYVRHRAELAGVPRAARAAEIAKALAEVSIADRAGDPIGKLSKGLRQRAALAGILVAGPTLLALDEPASGLDELQRNELRATLRALTTGPSGGRTVLWSTHELSDVEAAADQVIVLAGGRVVADGTVPEIKRAAGTGAAPLRDAILKLTATGPAAAAETEAEADAETDAETDTETDAETDAETETETDAETDAKAQGSEP